MTPGASFRAESVDIRKIGKKERVRKEKEREKEPLIMIQSTPAINLC